ncbi:hypothetical protein [Streptococcus merionis]|uniref:hypothetical protein n=1 Tax=Streptococcus merionis TaxID=400065 RepID=UPI0035181381
MALFDEVQQLSSESHDKWFDRYFKKYDIINKIKISAQQGYSGYLIAVLSVKDEYTQRRLDDERTLVKLREMLGEGFTVEFEITYGKNIFSGREYISNKQIHITWA